MESFQTDWNLSSDQVSYLASKGIDIKPLRSKDGRKTHHTHPFLATVRNWAEQALLSTVTKGAVVKSVGGNDVRHRVRHKDYKIHSCCPILSPQDVIREVKRQGKPRGDYCRERFERCTKEADVYLFSNSLYYIEREALAVLPVGSIVLAAHHVYPEPGVYAFGEMTVAGDPTGWTVHTNGNTFPYQHAQCWLTSACVISVCDRIIAFDVVHDPVDTYHLFRGVVFSSSDISRTMCIEPVLIPQDPPITELERYIAADATGVTLDLKTLHSLALRARAYLNTHEQPMPTNIGRTIARSLRKAMRDTTEMIADFEPDTIANYNDEIAQYSRRNVAETAVRRDSAWSITWITTAICTMVITYTITTPLRFVKEASVRTHSYIKGGWYRMMMAYARSKWRAPRWIVSCDNPDLPTYVPANCPDNEITSIIKRALPPDRNIRIPAEVREIAQAIAVKIGKVSVPLDFDEWLQRFPPERRVQLAEAHLKPLDSSVEFFQKIEQLDQPKDPRAIQARDDTYKAHLGPWVAAFEHRCRETLPIFVKGLGDEEKAKKVYDVMSTTEHCLEVDFSRFDRTLSWDLLDATEHEVYRMVFPPVVAAQLALQRVNNIRTRNNVHYRVFGTRMSGDVNTSIGNCIVNACAMVYLGLRLDRLLVEGDDMLAAITERERRTLDIDRLKQLGLEPKAKVVPSIEAEFCSRRIVLTPTGPRLVRDPRREGRRIGYSVHNAQREDKLRSAYVEWRGIPTWGPVLARALGQGAPEIDPETRHSFETAWGISKDAQIEFETSADAREAILDAIASPDAPPTGDCYRQVPRALGRSGSGDNPVPLRARIKRAGSPRRAGGDVRDVPPEGTSQDPIQSRSRHYDQRRDPDGGRLRRKGLRQHLPGHGRPVPKGDGPSVEGRHPNSTPRPGNEAEVARDGDGHEHSGHRNARKLSV
nr:hypothetical protein 1 [Mute swan feces associated tombus-like virus 1]